MTPSPCNKICRINGAATLCVGCGRTVEEIKTWTALSDYEKQQVVEKAKARLEERLK